MAILKKRFMNRNISLFRDQIELILEEADKKLSLIEAQRDAIVKARKNNPIIESKDSFKFISTEESQELDLKSKKVMIECMGKLLEKAAKDKEFHERK